MAAFSPRRLAAACLALILTIAADKEPAKRPPEPDAAARRVAEAEIKGILKTEYAAAKRDAAAREALARKLLQLGVGETKKLALRYACFVEARDIAGKNGDVQSALDAAGEMAKSFDVDPLRARSDALDAARPTLRTPQALRLAVDEYFRLIDGAVLQDKIEMAVVLGNGLSAVAEKSKSPRLVAEANAKKKQIRDIKAEYERIEKHRASLAAGGTDPEARSAAGKFLCLYKDDWTGGVPLLARGSDPISVSLGTREEAAPAQPGAQTELGDAWWTFSSSESGLAKLRAQKRAVFWYEKAMQKLGGVERAKLEKRVEEYDAAADAAVALRLIYLSDLQEEDVSAGYGRFGKKGQLGYNATNNPALSKVVVRGKQSPNGISFHANEKGTAYVTYKLDPTDRFFQGEAGLIDGDGKPAATPLVFRVVGDGKVLWASEPISKAGSTQKYKVHVGGNAVLRIEVECPGSFMRAHAVWVEPALLRDQ